MFDDILFLCVKFELGLNRAGSGSGGKVADAHIILRRRRSPVQFRTGIV